MLIVGTTFFTSCETEEEPAKPNENVDIEGNIARIKVNLCEKVEEPYTEIVNQYDEKGNIIGSEKLEGVDYITKEVPNKIIYMFALDDWDKFGKTIDKTLAIDKTPTDESGIAIFDFKEKEYDKKNSNYVLVCFNSDGSTSIPGIVATKEGKEATITVYTTGEEPTGFKYSNLFKTYELKELQSHATLTLPWFRDGSDAYFKVNIPEKTSSWYCELTCTKAQDESGFKLLANLANMFDKRVGLALDAVSKLTTPDGTEACNFYVFNKEEFLKYQKGQKCNTIILEKNFKQGLVKEYTKVEPGEYYFVFHNPYFYKVYVNYELVAVIENE